MVVRSFAVSKTTRLISNVIRNINSELYGNLIELCNDTPDVDELENNPLSLLNYFADRVEFLTRQRSLYIGAACRFRYLHRVLARASRKWKKNKNFLPVYKSYSPFVKSLIHKYERELFELETKLDIFRGNCGALSLLV